MMDRESIRTEVLDLTNEVTYGFWSKAQINRRINTAYKDLVRHIHNTGRHHYQKSDTITTSASTWTVDLPSDCVQVYRIYDSDGNTLQKGMQQNFDNSNSGEPSYWDMEDYNSICFDVTPDSTYTYTVEYVYEPDDMSSDTDTPSVPVGGDYIIALICAYGMLMARGDSHSVEMYRRMAAARDEYITRICRPYAGGPDKIQRGDRNYGIRDWRGGTIRDWRS